MAIFPHYRGAANHPVQRHVPICLRALLDGFQTYRHHLLVDVHKLLDITYSQILCKKKACVIGTVSKRALCLPLGPTSQGAPPGCVLMCNAY